MFLRYHPQSHYGRLYQDYSFPDQAEHLWFGLTEAIIPQDLDKTIIDKLLNAILYAFYSVTFLCLALGISCQSLNYATSFSMSCRVSVCRPSLTWRSNKSLA